MKKHNRQIASVIIITVLVVVYYIVYFGWLCHLIGGVFGALLGVVPFVLGGVMVYVCVQRIQEIRSGEEDDLSQY